MFQFCLPKLSLGQSKCSDSKSGEGVVGASQQLVITKLKLLYRGFNQTPKQFIVANPTKVCYSMICAYVVDLYTVCCIYGNQIVYFSLLVITQLPSTLTMEQHAIDVINLPSLDRDINAGMFCKCNWHNGNRAVGFYLYTATLIG